MKKVLAILIFVLVYMMISCSSDNENNDTEETATCLVDVYDKIIPEYGKYYRIFVTYENEDESYYEIETKYDDNENLFDYIQSITGTRPYWNTDGVAVIFKLNNDIADFTEDGDIGIICRCKDHKEKVFKIYNKHKSEDIDLCDHL